MKQKAQQLQLLLLFESKTAFVPKTLRPYQPQESIPHVVECHSLFLTLKRGTNKESYYLSTLHPISNPIALKLLNAYQFQIHVVGFKTQPMAKLK